MEQQSVMAYFWMKNLDGEDIQVFYKGITEAKLSKSGNCLYFDYEPGDQYELMLFKGDVDEEVWDMLLQTLDLVAS